MGVTVVAGVCLAIVALAVIPVLHRMIVGPTILDRAVGLDALLVYVVMGLGIYSAVTGTSVAIIPALALTATGFIGTLALARFVARDEPRDHTAQNGQSESSKVPRGEEST